MVGREGAWLTLTQVKEGPLFVTSWDPQKYVAGLHTLMVLVSFMDMSITIICKLHVVYTQEVF